MSPSTHGRSEGDACRGVALAVGGVDAPPRGNAEGEVPDGTIVGTAIGAGAHAATTAAIKNSIRTDLV